MDNNKLKTLAKDLTREFPRSPREMLAGYVFACRTLDKCRATLAGTNGEYHFDCPLDNIFFSFAELVGEEWKAFVATGASDDEGRKIDRREGEEKTTDRDHQVEQRMALQADFGIVQWNAGVHGRLHSRVESLFASQASCRLLL